MADPKPPFTEETARKKVKVAQAAWNTRYSYCSHSVARPRELSNDGCIRRDPHRCSQAYTEDSIWRNRGVFLRGRAAIVDFLTAKWTRELDYRLRKELFAFTENRIAVQFWYEYRDADAAVQGQTVWRRAYGLEDWTFDGEGNMRKRMMSANDVEINEEERWFKGGLKEGEDCNELVQRAEIGEEHW